MVAATDVKVYKTTNNLGGAISGTPVISGTPNNLFVNIPKNEVVVGEDYYACVYIKNGHATESMDNFSFWLTNKSFPSNTTIKWAFDPVSTSTGYRWAPSFSATGSTFDSTADAPEYDLNNFTVAAWFKTSANYTTDGFIVNKGGSGSDSAGNNMNYGIWFINGNQVRGGFEETDGTDHFATSPLTYNDGLWHLAVCTYSGSHVRLYIDDMVTDVASHTTTATPETNAQPLVIGRNSRVSDKFFTGEIDEVRVWDRFKSEGSRVSLLSNIIQQTGLIFEKSFGTDTNVLTAQTIADKYTAPTGVTWNELGSAPSSPNYGKLAAGASFPIWIWYHVPANAVEIMDDSETFSFKFDIPQGGTGTGGGTDCAEGTYHYEPYENFEGVGPSDLDYIRVADSAALDLLQFSLSLWFRTSYDYTPHEGMMLIKGLGVYSGAGTAKNYFIKINNTPHANKLEAGFQTAAGAGNFGFTDTTYNDGQWHHVAMTYDQVTLIFYVDGVEVDSWATTATPETNATDLIIGADPDETTASSRRQFNGDLDEVRIWNNDLTPQEVLDLYNNGDIPQTGAIVYENLFGGSGGDCGGSGGSGGNPPPANTDYKIAIAGDWGCEPETDDVIDLIQSEGYDHVIGVGDNAYESASCWTTRFNPIKSIMNSAYGNHEYSESGGTGPYKTFFGHSLTYFTYKFENIQFFVCDTNINIADGSTQHTFMENALAASQNDNTITWRIAIMHHPWFGADSDHSYNEFDQVQELHELFQNNGVRIVCVGHNHNWQRTDMVSYNEDDPTDPTVVDSSSPFSNDTVGLIHVVTGTGGHDTGGSLYDLGSQPSFQAYQNNDHNGVWEIVASNNGQTLTCSFVEVGGDKFDTFTITA